MKLSVDTFYFYLEILNLTQAPTFRVPFVKKSIPLRYRVLCCYNYDSWVYKRCAKISETKFKSIKMKATGFYFDCYRCNYAKEMPFFQEECLEENPENVYTVKEHNMVCILCI